MEEELKDEISVYEEFADVNQIEPNFRIKNGDVIHHTHVCQNE
jgi:hypothetical protein